MNALLATLVLTQALTATRAQYEGRFELEAHLRRPHAVATFQARATIVETPTRVRLDLETWSPNRKRDAQDVETFLLDGERVLHRPDASKPFVEELGLAAALARQRVESFLPNRALAAMKVAPEVHRESDAVATWNDAVLGARRLERDPATETVTSLSRSYAHPRLGDVRDEARYSAWETRDGVRIPTAITVRELEGVNPLTASPGAFDVHLTEFDAHFDATAVLALPEAKPVAPAPSPESKEITVEEVEPGLVSFLAKEEQGRTWTVEFADHLVAIDAPLSSALGERILAAIHARFPTKPVRWVLFGHYHPHYTGALRAFLAAGAKVAAPEGCARFAREIAERPFTLEPDAWARANRTAEIETFTGSRVFEDATRRLEAIDLGAASGHTDEHLLFHLARTKTLLQDDVGWYAGPDGKLRFAAGAKGILDAITKRGLAVETLRQSWPVDHPRPSISIAELEAGVRAAK